MILCNIFQHYFEIIPQRKTEANDTNQIIKLEKGYDGGSSSCLFRLFTKDRIPFNQEYLPILQEQTFICP